MSMGLGASFDRAQRAYDAQSPPEGGPSVENECQRCHELFETDRPSDRYCPKCLGEIAQQDEG